MDENEQFRLKVGLAEMLKGGVIMDVMTADQARIAEESGACAVMALERIPAIIRREGGVARMSDPRLIREIEAAVSIPVMAKCRIGHLAEAQILEALGVDFIDESEVLTPADEENHIAKRGFKVPFVCGCRDLGEALRRIGEGAAMIRTKGEAGTGDIVEAVRHMRAVQQEIRRIQGLRDEELMATAKHLGAPYEIVLQVRALGKLPVPNFAAGGVATPADASLMMQLGAESVFVGSGIFEVGDREKPEEQRRDQLRMARAIVQAVANYDKPEILAQLSEGLPKAMKGISVAAIPAGEQLAKRGW
jgi:pyridoxal 5'-phosphate synthase pdxS subunit